MIIALREEQRMTRFQKEILTQLVKFKKLASRE
jgi:hypothetical protein